MIIHLLCMAMLKSSAHCSYNIQNHGWSAIDFLLNIAAKFPLLTKNYQNVVEIRRHFLMEDKVSDDT